MAFLRRFTTLLRADAHGALDALEDKPTLLRQYLRDAEEALAAKKARLQGLEAEARDLERGAERLAPRLEALGHDVDLALKQERSDLARFAVAKLLPMRRQAEGIAARRRDLEQEKAELVELIEHQQSQLGDLRLRVRAAIEEAENAAGSGECFTPGSVISEQDIELELLRRQSATSTPPSTIAATDAP